MTIAKVVILYCPTGHGHHSAARAIAQALEDRRPDIDVEVLDALRFAPRSFHYDRLWRLIQQHGGILWDHFFDLTNRPYPVVPQWCREQLNLRLLAALARELEHRQPDRIVCTHHLPALLVGKLACAGRLRGKTSVLITDYHSHEAWISRGVGSYYVATHSAARALVNRGVDERAIARTGIPVAREMAEERLPIGRVDSKEGLRALFLAAGAPRPLVREALQSLSGFPRVSLDIVCGSDARLLRLVSAWKEELGITARLHGFLPTLKPLMDQAHVVVTKAGGLVVSECLARGRAMVFPWPAPGQERANRAYAVEAGAAVALSAPGDTGAEIRRMANQPSRLAWMASAACRASSRHAAAEIAEDLLRGLPPANAARSMRHFAAGGAR